MPAKIEGAKRADMFRVSPRLPKIVGLDTPADPADELYVAPTRLASLADDAMVESIVAEGVIQPVSLARRGADWFVVLGRRRVFNARRALARVPDLLVPAVVAGPMDGARAAGVIAIENALRVGDSPVERARAAARMVEMFALSHDAVGVRFGVSAKTVREWLKMLRAAPAVLAAVDAGQITAKAATELATVPRGEQRDALASLVATAAASGGAVTARAAALEREVRGARARGEETPEGRPTLRELRRMIAVAESAPVSPVTDEALAMLRWFVGDLRDRDVRGMTALRRAAKGA